MEFLLVGLFVLLILREARAKGIETQARDLAFQANEYITFLSHGVMAGRTEEGWLGSRRAEELRTDYVTALTRIYSATKATKMQPSEVDELVPSLASTDQWRRLQTLAAGARGEFLKSTSQA